MQELSKAKRILYLVVPIYVVAALASVVLLRQRIEEPIVQGPGVTKVGHLSDYLDNLKGSPADAKVYFLEGARKGGTILIFGAHPCEPAALVTHVLLIERAKVSAGRVIVIPRAQKTGFDDLDAGQGYPARFHIARKEGDPRWFRMGGRMTAEYLQWPLPTVHVNYPSGQTLSDIEALNLNRAFPGRPDGTLTERIAYAIVELVKKEKVDIVIDNHEAPPDRPLVKAVCAHDRAMNLAAQAILLMEMDYGIQIRLEVSPPNLRGLSHREIGDHTDALVMLNESPSPMHGPLRGRATEELLLTAKDPFELRAAKMGRVFCPYDENGYPIDQRVGYKIAFVEKVTEAFTEMHPYDKPIIITNLPTYDDIMKNGLGECLAPPPEPEPRLYLVSKYLF
jgi:hypothetical protein